MTTTSLRSHVPSNTAAAVCGALRAVAMVTIAVVSTKAPPTAAPISAPHTPGSPSTAAHTPTLTTARTIRASAPNRTAFLRPVVWALSAGASAASVMTASLAGIGRVPRTVLGPRAAKAGHERRGEDGEQARGHERDDHLGGKHGGTDGTERDERHPGVDHQRHPTVRVAQRQQPVVQMYLVRGERAPPRPDPPDHRHDQIEHGHEH